MPQEESRRPDDSNVSSSETDEAQARYDTLLAQLTKLQHREEKLRRRSHESRQKMKGLDDLNIDMENVLRSTQIGTILLDIDLRIRSFTPAIRAQFELTEDDLGRPLDHLSSRLTQDDLKLLHTHINIVLGNGEPKEREIQTKDGRHYLKRIYPFLNRQRKIEGIVLTFVDITQTQLAKEQQARFQSIFNAVSDLASFVDTNYIYQAVNEQYVQYWQVEKQDIVGKHVAELVGEEQFNKVIRVHLDNCLAGQQVRYQQWFQYPVKGRRYMDVSYNPVFKADGSLDGVTVNVRDITMLKEQEDLLSEALTQLKRSNADLEQFAYAASHDLQEPLNTVANFIGLLQSDYAAQLDDEAILYLSMTYEGAQRMKQLIEALLQYSQLRRIELRYEPIDFAKMIREVKESLQDLMARTQARIHVSGDLTIRGDERLLRHLFQNLFTNAIKFQQPGIQPEITLSVVEEAAHWLVRVQDNGIGIAEKHFNGIFGIFRRLHTRDEYKGTGLGLALCKQIVTLHGGEIWLTSEAGQGSTFFFTLPKLDE